MESSGQDAPPSLFTQEVTVLRSGLEKADRSKPVSVYTDSEGNQALADGNHRAYSACLTGTLSELPRKIIGKIPRDVSKDPNYKEISKLKVVDK
ncbi:MAG: hypothetical protein US43_C0021G0008 [Candidatus Levybacteria bacterium GW2011_GWA1_37_16]|nr:MAG: hypothetical protein US43_C0021G0008 [Candidatus Levybacteria bacterium GW2011_GWA1_37_16]